MIRLNASALPRVLACLGSTQFPQTQEVEQSEAAREGDAAHHAAECVLKGVPIPDVAPNGYAVDAEMREHAQAYRDTIPKVVNEGTFDAFVPHVEKRADFYATPTIEIAVRLDAWWLDGDTLYIRDYKYGWRLVEPEGNYQLVAGAVGVIRQIMNPSVARMVTDVPPTFIDMGIYQPRPYHPDGQLRTWRVSIDELIMEYNGLVERLEQLPSSDLLTGPHCEHCPGGVLGTCPAALAAAGNAIDVAMRGGPMDPSPAAMARELVTLQRAAKVLEQRKTWLEDIAKRGLKAGQVFPGWAVEQAKGNSTWTVKPKELTQLTNVDVYAERKLCTPAEAKRRGVSEDVIAANTTRPNIGDRLVRRDPDAYVRKKVGKKKGKGDGA